MISTARLTSARQEKEPRAANSIVKAQSQAVPVMPVMSVKTNLPLESISWGQKQTTPTRPRLEMGVALMLQFGRQLKEKTCGERDWVGDVAKFPKVPSLRRELTFLFLGSRR